MFENLQGTQTTFGLLTLSVKIQSAKSKEQNARAANILGMHENETGASFYAVSLLSALLSLLYFRLSHEVAPPLNKKTLQPLAKGFMLLRVLNYFFISNSARSKKISSESSKRDQRLFNESIDSASPESAISSPVFKNKLKETNPLSSRRLSSRTLARLTNLKVQPLSVQYFNRIDFIVREK
ncbi:MAG: hypothetical protein RLZZ96_304 [Bacteroidota bacterium]